MRHGTDQQFFALVIYIPCMLSALCICPELIKPTHGTTVTTPITLLSRVTGFYTNSTAITSCQGGYQLLGEAVSLCNETCGWTDVLKSCLSEYRQLKD